MIPAINDSARVPWLPIILSASHIVLLVLTFSYEKTASGGNPFVCVDLPWSIAPFAEGHGSRILLVGILGNGPVVFHWVHRLVKQVTPYESGRIDDRRVLATPHLYI